MKIINKIGLVCLIVGIVMWISAYFLYKKIGGSAANGYHNDKEYIVCDVEGKNSHDVSRLIWYISYIYSTTTAIFIVLDCVFIFYLSIRYIGMPIWKKNGKIFD
jgi:hypothetical protein